MVDTNNQCTVIPLLCAGLSNTDVPIDPETAEPVEVDTPNEVCNSSYIAYHVLPAATVGIWQAYTSAPDQRKALQYNPGGG